MWSSRIASTIPTYNREDGFSASSAARIKLPPPPSAHQPHTTGGTPGDEPVRCALRFGIGAPGGTYNGDLVVLHGGSTHTHQLYKAPPALSPPPPPPLPAPPPAPPQISIHTTYPTIFSAICAGNFPTLVPPNFWITQPPAAEFFLRSWMVVAAMLFARRNRLQGGGMAAAEEAGVGDGRGWWGAVFVPFISISFAKDSNYLLSSFSLADGRKSWSVENRRAFYTSKLIFLIPYVIHCGGHLCRLCM